MATSLRCGHFRVPIGISTNDYRIPPFKGLPRRISTERKPLSIPKGSPSIGEKDGFSEQEARALYGVPLLHNGEMLGIAYIGSPDIQEFTVADYASLFGSMRARGMGSCKTARALRTPRGTDRGTCAHQHRSRPIT